MSERHVNNIDAAVPRPDPFISGLGIRKISVELLFGQLTYELQDIVSPPGKASKVLLLYGDNGAGKTTILRILFFLLSHIDGRGHKTKVARIRFKRFEVNFADGTKVVAEREDYTVPEYEVRVTRGDSQLAQAAYGDDPSRRKGAAEGNFNRLLVNMSPVDSAQILEDYYQKERREENHKQLLATLKSLDLGLIYLSDTRYLYSTDPPLTKRTVKPVAREKEVDDEHPKALDDAVERISAWATKQAFKGSTQGEDDVNAVYSRIISGIAHAPSPKPSEVTLPELVKALRELEMKSTDLVRFGLTKPFNAEEIVANLNRISNSSVETVVGILEPYVSGIRARFDAMEPIRAQLYRFVETINSFYRNKSVRLDLDQGMVISSSGGDRLSPDALSSGEGQLLFILASTLVAKENSRLFMIDEPEISLNVKWQRMLISSLLELAQGSNMQFLLATHSIELLTLYSEFVLDLEPIK
jgi:energy-coupling factor transporter ATP-binding protein EcfA2